MLARAAGHLTMATGATTTTTKTTTTMMMMCGGGGGGWWMGYQCAYEIPLLTRARHV